ncbi:MAG: SDR family oxidoreductase [Polyangiaceae bacterium]
MEKRIVLVTGATSGIGRHAALELARAGHRVFATGRQREALASLEKEAAGLPGTPLETLVLDVSKPESVEEARRTIEAKTGGHGVDAVVNNAGYGVVGPVEEIDTAAMMKQYETNVFGLLRVTKAFLPKMRERGFGRVVNVSSIGGRITFPMMGMYNSTKYAVESLSDAMRVELAPFGIGVSLIEPGSIKTEFADVAVSTLEKREGSPYEAAIAQADQMRAKFDSMAVGPAVVTRAIQKAIESRRPRARYVAPGYAVSTIWLMKLLPTRWVDALMGRMSGLTRKNLVGDAAPRRLAATA